MNTKSQNEIFDKLYSEFSGRVYAYLSACAGADNAADLTQQTFLNLWKHMKYAGKEPDNYKAWVFRIAINVKNDFLRQKKRYPQPVEFCDELDTEILQDDYMTETAAVKNALEKLTDEQREIILLCSAGLDSNETGKALGISASAARSRLAKARSVLKCRLQECGVICFEKRAD
jgi:RNA polymerase sigma factor (sigma-70 family)